MAVLYEQVLRPALFTLESERAHEVGLRALALLARLGPLNAAMAWWHALPTALFRPVEAFGLKFPNTVGLAAGFDKNAEAWEAAAALGFGHVEIGTITALAQPGNPAPRMFRYPAEEAIINRMGFNNAGAVAVAARLAGQTAPGQRRIPLGINLGKSKVTPLDEAVADYLASFNQLAEHADYLVVNVSSPNTPDLRRLQEKDRLEAILQALLDANTARQQAGKARRPLLLKIAPDLSYQQIDEVLECVLRLRLDGLIATNTTLARPGTFDQIQEAGGLSGRPLRTRSTEILHYISRATGGKLPLIGVGGITDAASAGEKLDAGATLVQLYTGLVYRGPFFAAELARGLAERQRR